MRRPKADVPSSEPSEFDEAFLNETMDIPDEVVDRVVESAHSIKEEIKNTLITPDLVKGALAPTFETIFATMASFRGEHWKLEKYQTDALVVGWTPIVQIMLAKLGSETEVLLAGALIPTMAIVGGKIAQEATLRASSTANGRTGRSEASSASSASGGAARQPAQSSSSVIPFES